MTSAYNTATSPSTPPATTNPNQNHQRPEPHAWVQDVSDLLRDHSVELVKAYSNHADHVERFRLLLDLPRAARPSRSEHPPKQAQRRLDAEGVARLVAAYAAGGRVTKLATQFGIHRDTGYNILKRQGVLRPSGIQPGELPEVVRLYEEGWSMARLAAEFDVSPSTVNRALRKAGASIRQPGPPRDRRAS